jgi:hypothetical protein
MLNPDWYEEKRGDMVKSTDLIKLGRLNDLGGMVAGKE